MGVSTQSTWAFIAFLPLLALAAADQHSHQSVKHGNAPAVTSSIHKPHGGYHAIVHSQPAATPDEVHQYHNEEKYAAANHAPVPAYANKPVHHGLVHHALPHAAHPVHHALAHPVHHAPIHHAPIYHPAPAYKAAPVYHPAPAYKPAPVYHPAPAYRKPAPVYHPAPAYKPAPVYKPAHPVAPYHEPAYNGPAVYQYGYAVADDYSGANFAQSENRDGYATTGEYRVALPDGRTQIVTYSVGDAYSGY